MKLVGHPRSSIKCWAMVRPEKRIKARIQCGNWQRPGMLTCRYHDDHEADAQRLATEEFSEWQKPRASNET